MRKVRSAAGRTVLNVHARVMRILERRGLLELGSDDMLAHEAPALSACCEGAVTQRVGLGPMRGRPMMKLGTSLMERLAAQIPKPRVNLVLYAGVLAPHAKLRASVVTYARRAPIGKPPAIEEQTRAGRETWSELMRMTFGVDVLACSRCGGRMRHIATILDPRVARRILEYLERSARAPPVHPVHDPPAFWRATEAWN
jgi:hypothetical protein